ncbi:MAG TPA: hypothetical protein VMV40_03760 [Acidiferrobacter sp.]|nr:hypothetical protein [Acidiferrobacter sp.]
MWEQEIERQVDDGCTGALEHVRVAKTELLTAVDEVVSRLVRDVKALRDGAGPCGDPSPGRPSPARSNSSETYEERKLMAVFDEFEWAVVRLRESCRAVAFVAPHPVSSRSPVLIAYQGELKARGAHEA